MYGDIIPKNMEQQAESRQELIEYVREYLNNAQYTNKNKELEFEIRFGTKGIKNITKVDYENVIRKLISNGYEFRTKDASLLRMSPEYIDKRTGLSKISNMRVEISGIENVQNYCSTNDLRGLLDGGKVKFVTKKPLVKGDDMMKPINYDEWNFRASLQEEITSSINGNIVQNTLRDWNDTKKVYRLITRSTLVKRLYSMPLFEVDVSVVRESRRRGRFLVPEYTFETSGVIDALPKYEIEFEINKAALDEYKQMTRMDGKDPAQQLERDIRSMVLMILSGLQETNFPVSYTEQKSIAQAYMALVQGKIGEKEKKDDKDGRESRVYPKHFIGPSSYTLSVKNIAPINDDANIPNIRNNYTVTDKADGERKLLYISGNGRVYLIDTNMNVQFTGCVEKDSTFRNTLLDGEHIVNGKSGRFINLYAAFDVYFVKGKDVRRFKFVTPEGTMETEIDKMTHRLPILVNVVRSVKITSLKGGVPPLRVTNKTFQISSDAISIFQGCALILRNVREGLYEYNTDGLIFTPSNLGVGMNNDKDTPKNVKTTWDYSFKWKPIEFNTIDFLVTTKKTDTGQEFIGNIFQEGVDTRRNTQISQYKTAILRVGFDERKHGFINPCQDIIEEKYADVDNKDEEDGYRPMQFFPTNPYDPEAGVCKLMLEGSLDNKSLMTEDGEPFGDNTIVEFRYDVNRKPGWRWVPIKVRYDKTADYLAGGKNYGNAYHVANSNWHSIHNPITEEMISTGNNIPDELSDDDVYYNRVTNDSMTRALRDFHNLYVKKLLITRTAKRGGTIIDMAVGKGGDIPKWIAARASFVLGIDYSKDNIENRLDGACARYLNYRRKFKSMPDALFVHGDSTLNIRNTDALYTDKAKQIVRAVFGMGPKDAKVLGNGVYKQFGKGEKGFDLTSIQFSIHYMFRDQQTVQNLMRNISECTKVGGYFISTQYDGQRVFDSLRDKKQGETVTIIEDDKKIWEITKQYDRDEFQDDSSCVGYAIDVYQETINKVFREYLVNYNYVVRLMENYGFVPLTNEESRRLGLNGSTGMFSELFGLMQNEVRRDPEAKNQYGSALDMTPSDKRIAFLNRWMIFKKIRDVDAEKVARNLLEMSVREEHEIDVQTKNATESMEDAVISMKPAVPPRKLKKRVKLVLMERL